MPLLSAANWGGQGLHLRGNIEGFVRAASKHKWLEVHGLEHWTHFYTDYGRELQLAFFDHFLHGKDNGWDKAPRVLLQVRHLDRFVARHENEWPLARTRWTKLHLDPRSGLLRREKPAARASLGFDATGDGVTFLSAPLEAETEITGPSALKLLVSSTTSDADLFVVLRAFAPDLKEVVFQGAIDPHTPIGQGWLRASHRKLDKRLSTPWRPYHTHDRRQPLKPGEVVELDIEIWPTCVVLPAGYRLGLTIRGKDYEYPGPSGGRLSNFKNELKGCGPFLHDDARDRPPEHLRWHYDLALRARPAALPVAASHPTKERQHQREQGHKGQKPAKSEGVRRLMITKLTTKPIRRRTVLKGMLATGAGAVTLPMPAIAQGSAVQDRPAHGQDRAAGAGRHPDGAGHRHIPQGEELHAGWAQGGAAGRRHRRQSGGRPHQGPGGDRARQGQRDPRDRWPPSSCSPSPTTCATTPRR